MKVLDATFLIDYLDGVESTREYLQAHDSEAYVLPVPAYAEALLGEGNGPGGDIEGAREDPRGARYTPSTNELRLPLRRSQTKFGHKGRSSPGWTH